MNFERIGIAAAAGAAGALLALLLIGLKRLMRREPMLRKGLTKPESFILLSAIITINTMNASYFNDRVSDFLHPQSRLEKMATAKTAEFQKDPRFLDYIKRESETSTQDPRTVGAAMSVKGLTRIDSNLQVQRAKIFNVILEKGADKNFCAALLTGNQTELNKLSHFLELLDDATLNEWFDINMASMRALLDDRPDHQLTQPQIDEVFQTVGNTLNHDDAERFGKTLSELSKASVDDQCWAAKKLYGMAADETWAMRDKLALLLVMN